MFRLNEKFRILLVKRVSFCRYIAVMFDFNAFINTHHSSIVGDICQCLYAWQKTTHSVHFKCAELVNNACCKE